MLLLDVNFDLFGLLTPLSFAGFSIDVKFAEN